MHNSKRDYYVTQFVNHKNPKQTWKTTNDILGENFKQNNVNEVKLTERTKTSTEKLVEVFNDYFKNVCCKLAEAI